MSKFNILNKSLDLWVAENLTEKKAKEMLIDLRQKELEKPLDDWRYEYEIKRTNNK